MKKELFECKVKSGVRNPWQWIKSAEVRGCEIVIFLSDVPCFVDPEFGLAACRVFRFAKSRYYHLETHCTRVDTFDGGFDPPLEDPGTGSAE